MKKNKKTTNDQICIDDISLLPGDKLYKNNELFAQVSAVSESLYMLIRKIETEEIAIPYRKEVLINQILSGKYTIETLKF